MSKFELQIRFILLVIINPMELLIRTGIAYKKIPCYMRGSACRWFLVKKDKTFWNYVKHFWILAGVGKYKILIGLCKYPTIFLNEHNKTKLVPSFFFLLLRLLTVIISLYFKKLKIVKCFLYIAIAKHN